MRNSVVSGEIGLLHCEEYNQQRKQACKQNGNRLRDHFYSSDSNPCFSKVCSYTKKCDTHTSVGIKKEGLRIVTHESLSTAPLQFYYTSISIPFRSVKVSLPSVSTVTFSTISRHSRSSNLSIRIPFSSRTFTSPSSSSLRESLATF